MVISNPDTANAAQQSGGSGDSNNHLAHPSGIPQDQIDNIMSGIANTGGVKMNNHRKKLKQRFDIIKKLGQGTYGKVQLGINKETGQEVAIKTIKKCKIEAEADLVRIRREVQIMSSVQHPNIIHIYEVFENREKMVLVMEFAAGGELYDYLSERKVLSEEEARRIFRQVATAVYYCHKHKICHRDLKLENILLDETGNAKIADFGLSNVFDEQRMLATFCGSPLYASPEIVEGTPYQGPEVDCWSLGVLLYTLVYGSMPFDGSNFKRLVTQISQGDYYEPKQPSRASTLIRAMLTVCPRKRATIEQICSHWWVNENDNVSCLDLAEDLANQTPVRLDVLLSVTPTAITADQLVVPSADGKQSDRIARSHSVGSIRDISAGTTEAEQRILDMVAAGGEAALMPSPTRTITPAQSPVQTKRKLETTISTENAVGAVKKKEKPSSSLKIDQLAAQTLNEETPMDTEETVNDKLSIPVPVPTPKAKPASTTAATAAALTTPPAEFEQIGQICDELLERKDKKKSSAQNDIPTETKSTASAPMARQKTAAKLDAVEEAPEEKEATKVIKKFVNKHKTADLVNAIGQATGATTAAVKQPEQVPANKNATVMTTSTPFVRKCSLQDETALNKFNTDRRKSRILETAEKFQQMNAATAANTTTTNAATNDKPKKLVIPGVSVGSFKKEFERKATGTNSAQSGPTPGEKRALEEFAAAQAAAAAAEAESESQEESQETINKTSSGFIVPITPPSPSQPNDNVENSDSKTSISSLTLEDARRSMENSIALLRQAQNESSKEVDQLCAKTADIGVTDKRQQAERERKLKTARTIIGNAIQPVIRRPPISLLFGIGGGGYGPERDDSGVYINNNSQSTNNKLNTVLHNNNNNNFNNNHNKYNNNSNNHINNNHINNNYNNNNMFNKEKQQQSYSARPLPTSYSQPTTPQTSPLTPVPPLQTPTPPTQMSRTIPRQTAPAAASVNNMALAAARQTIVDRLAAGGIGKTSAASSFKALTPVDAGHHAPTAINRFNSYSNSFLSQQKEQEQLQLQQQQLQNQQQQQQQNKDKFAKHYQTNNNDNLFISTLPQHQQQQLQQQQRMMSQYRKTTAINPKSIYTNATAATPIANASTNASQSNSAAQLAYNAITNSTPKPFYNAQPTYPQIPMASLASPDAGAADTVKTSTASITLKSATLPRRKPGNKSEIQLDIKPRIVEQPTMRFTTEMQHPVADLRTAPPRDGPVPYSPIKTFNPRATSLEPKEHIIPIQRPPAYARTTSNTTTRSGSLSRQSTVDSETESTATTTNMSHATIGGPSSSSSSQPIKKSPREFIIPIAVEGGGFITPREGSIEPSDSSHTAATATSSRNTFSRLRPTRRIGSLLSDTGIDDNMPFQKLRTASQIVRDGVGDEDDHFTLHKLRSSRPVKKVGQDNDDESSNEEDDDDDGFEILTAENLFSTLLQRVRALTNRFNVNNDFTTGFPNSSRLLGNMRHGQSTFWNQEPFGGSRLNNSGENMSNAPWRHSMSRDLGRDMESMFSRTGATLPRGNKLANHSACTTTTTTSRIMKDSAPTPAPAAPAAAAETASATPTAEPNVNTDDDDTPLDLADLDLSRLRLSKKELETLSSIAPGLPKCFQEQLLAKLPPTQARKLSRTLSMQNNPHVTTVKIYKRSQSGGRGLLSATTATANDLNDETMIVKEEETTTPPAAVTTATPPKATAQDANIKLHRRSLSRPRNDFEATSSIPTATNTTDAHKSRSSSVCREDYSKSLCSSYTSDINDKYRYYSPYLSKSTKEPPTETITAKTAATAATTTSSTTDSGAAAPPYKRYTSISARDSVAMGRPPSGCLSPPPPLPLPQPLPTQIQTPASLNTTTPADGGGSGSLRRRSTQRRVSRFLRPDFFDEPLTEENAYQRERNAREREAQSVLREIREKSCEREELKRRKHSLPGPNGPAADAIPIPTAAAAAVDDGNKIPRHIRNKSMESYNEHQHCSVPAPVSYVSDEAYKKQHRRSLSRSRDITEQLDTHELADRILKELQLLSAVRSRTQQQQPDLQRLPADSTTVEPTTMEEKSIVESNAIVKKVKKIKPKEKSTESSTDNDATKSVSNNNVTAIKKVKKVIKKTDVSAKTPTNEITLPLNEEESDMIKKESKLKRPKSYPTKELVAPSKSELITTTLSNKTPTIPEAQNIEIANASGQLTGDTTMPRESRLLRPKSYPASKLATPKDLKKISRSGYTGLPTNIETESPNSINDVAPPCTVERPTSLKKVIKVTKKSKLTAPSALTPTTPSLSSTTTTTTSENSKETSPVTVLQVKEKSPDKKPSKGLLHAIGQKFEKLRDSAMNKEKKSNVAVSTLAACTGASTKKSSSDSSPEKIKEKTTSIRKKKSIDNSNQKTEKAPHTITDATTTASEETTATNSGATAAAAKATTKTTKVDKRSRIDAMLRSLRERSVPRSTPTANTESSNYIKRAISVEDLPGTGSRNAVNKVFGIFKRSEKDSNERRMRNTRSTSNLERELRDSTPTSPIYQNADVVKKEAEKIARLESNLICTKANCNCEILPANCPECRQAEAAAMATTNKSTKQNPETIKQLDKVKEPVCQTSRDRRKGLMLDLTDSSHKSSRQSKMASFINGNGSIYSNLPPYPDYTRSASNNSSSQLSMENVTHNSNNNNNSTSLNNNNSQHHHQQNSSSMQTSQTSGYRTSSTHEINRNNILTPSIENIPNYSPDSRSYQDDCASTSTFLSPTDEPELYFDNWSICSEDNYMMHATPSPTVSRLSRASQLSSPTRCESSDPNESVIDRIKRRSFYCRFNEKKPKRTSSIVGPNVTRDYYREQQAAVRARSSHKLSERAASPDITQEFFRPLKLSPVGTELKPPIYRAKPAHDYTSGGSSSTKSRKSLTDIRTPTSSSSSYLAKRYGSTAATANDNDYHLSTIPTTTRYKSSSSSSGGAYENNGASGGVSGYYNTYNPKRRSSYTLNGTLPSGSGSNSANGPSAGTSKSNIDSYATMGRRTVRAYDQRTMSLLDPSTAASYRRDPRTPVRDYTSSISRTNSRYRTSSISRSPTNI